MRLHLALHFSQLHPEGVKISTSGLPPPPSQWCLERTASTLSPSFSVSSPWRSVSSISFRCSPAPFHGRVQHSLSAPFSQERDEQKGKQHACRGEAERPDNRVAVKNNRMAAHRPLAGWQSGLSVPNSAPPDLHAPTLATLPMPRPVKGRAEGARGTVIPNGVPGEDRGTGPARTPALQRRPGGPHARLTRTTPHTKAPGPPPSRPHSPAEQSKGTAGPGAAHHRCA